MAVLPHGLQSAIERLAGGLDSGRLSPLRHLYRSYIAEQQRHARLLLAIQVLYACLFGGWLVYSHTWPAPDTVAVFLLFFAFLAARGLSFLRDWSPFILLVLGYVALSGIGGGLLAHAHVELPVQVDRHLFFGQLPTTVLQSHLWDPHHLHWYDYLATALYLLHFVIPLAVAFGFWTHERPLYWRFVGSYLLLCYAGFVTYVLYPMAPPWWAANAGRIPPVSDILAQVRFGAVADPIVLATRYFRPNEVAAMPSIHAAFPVLVWLVLWRTCPRWGWAVLAYPLAVAFSVIYLGQHYFVDVLAGWLYAGVAFYIVWGEHSWLRARRHALLHEIPTPVLVSEPATAQPVPARWRD